MVRRGGSSFRKVNHTGLVPAVRLCDNLIDTILQPVLYECLCTKPRDTRCWMGWRWRWLNTALLPLDTVCLHAANMHWSFTSLSGRLAVLTPFLSCCFRPFRLQKRASTIRFLTYCVCRRTRSGSLYGSRCACPQLHALPGSFQRFHCRLHQLSHLSLGCFFCGWLRFVYLFAIDMGIPLWCCPLHSSANSGINACPHLTLLTHFDLLHDSIYVSLQATATTSLMHVILGKPIPVCILSQQRPIMLKQLLR
mmetsp:Transcript_158558/g.279992  ORF Transcript_158558/g.279992 Transcript_158558/m.279992 type:complete len:251 (-) Transcript_158558:156-908(-)